MTGTWILLLTLYIDHGQLNQRYSIPLSLRISSHPLCLSHATTTYPISLNDSIHHLLLTALAGLHLAVDMAQGFERALRGIWTSI